MTDLKKYCRIYLNSDTPLDDLLKDEHIINNDSIIIAESPSKDKEKWWLMATKNAKNNHAIEISLETEFATLDSVCCTSNETITKTMTKMLEDICCA